MGVSPIHWVPKDDDEPGTLQVLSHSTTCEGVVQVVRSSLTNSRLARAGSKLLGIPSRAACVVAIEVMQFLWSRNMHVFALSKECR